LYPTANYIKQSSGRSVLFHVAGTTQQRTMESSSGAISIVQPDIHLNRASPRRQIYNLGPPSEDNLDAAEEFTQGGLDLDTSEDPEIRDYFEKRDRFKLLPSWRHDEGGRLSHVTHRKSQY
jgi:hypothetical protein